MESAMEEHNAASVPDFQVVIIGSGVAGAMVAYSLAQSNVRVLMLDAGGIVPDSLNRLELVRNFVFSGSKAPDTPFPAEIVAPQPAQDLATAGNNYYDQTPPERHPDKFKSFYERIVGGSTWHWQGINIRMLPRDFKMKSAYGVGFDWPINYDDLEPWYCLAEREMGVAGNDKQFEEVYGKRFGAYRSQRFPMPEIAPSYLDGVFSSVLQDKDFHFSYGPGGKEKGSVRLLVTTEPQARNSQPYDGRPACDGRTSCVPMCPSKARYEAVFHVEKALLAGAVLYEQSIVTRLEVGGNGNVDKVWYRRWTTGPKGEKQWVTPEKWVRGKIVVLAANGIESPKLLLLSNNIANRSRLVGKYLMDHPIKSSYALAPKPMFPYRGPQTTSEVAVLRDGDFRRHFAAFKTSLKNDGWSTVTGAPRGSDFGRSKCVDGNGKPLESNGTILDFVHNLDLFGSKLRNKINDHCTRQIVLNSACEMLPIESSQVSVSPEKDNLGIPRPKIDFKVDDETQYLRNCFKVAIALHKAIFDMMGIPPQDRCMNDAEINDLSKPLVFGGSGHIVGTTRMGADATNSVVDKDCRSHDHKNLFILGSSVFPTVSTANPTLTIAALALRAAEKIRRDLRLYR
jgi:choline dehydrogenase-like flavoprotein